MRTPYLGSLPDADAQYPPGRAFLEGAGSRRPASGQFCCGCGGQKPVTRDDQSDLQHLAQCGLGEGIRASVQNACFVAVDTIARLLAERSIDCRRRWAPVERSLWWLSEDERR